MQKLRGNSNSKQPLTQIKLYGDTVPALIDSGAAVNIISEKTYNKLSTQPCLLHTDLKILAYGSKDALPILGKFTGCVEAKNKTKTDGTFYVIKGDGCSLLRYQTADELGLIKIIRTIRPPSVNLTVADELVNSHPELFDGIEFRFMYVRKLKLSYRLEAEDIIEKVTGPTPWVSPIVTPPKPKDPDKVHICVDMRQANTAILRERHLTPTIDDVIHELNGATVFSKLDLTSGYHQLELHPNSRYITTFTTQLGLRRYKRLNFGISSAAEVFQNTIHQTLQGIAGVKNLSDDIIVYGATQADHDKSLTAVFQRLKERGLTLNRKKCEFNKTQLEFFGFIFSAGGVSADPKKVDAIYHAKKPKDAAEWGAAQDAALSTLRESLTSETTMAYFNPNRETELIVDASPVGLGAILLQKDTEKKHVIAYASRALSDVERRYSQTEREALVIVWSCEHFHLYIYGKEFTMVTDQKPLKLIWNNPRSKPPARIERRGLRLQPYNLKIEYRKGTDNPADYLSRHPIPAQSPTRNTRATKVAEEYVNFIMQNNTPKAMTLDEIKSETLKDATLQKVSALIRNNAWHTVTKDTALRQYEQVKSELTVSHEDDIILKGSRIVIPSSLEHRVLQLAHEAHQGITKTKALLREKVWFPGIDRRAEAMVRNCLACQATTPETHTEPLQMSDLPDTVWQDVSADFYGPLPTGEHLLVIVDEYSRYPMVEVIHSTSANSVIPVIDKIFSMFGIPRSVKTDNGPPFTSEQFSKFAAYMGFHHRKITPLWPQANATAERFMRTLGKCLRVAHMKNIPWKQHLYTFLRERNKLTATYNHKPYKVTTVKGSMVTAERDGHRVTRNSSFFKKLDPGLCDTSTAEEDEEVTADTVPVLAKYPARHRRPPQYLRDFVMD
ncbi:putative protein K02A2.6-like protein [Labeo rohita]|uniref:Gypsy retrotransposon integrase-like protein 1 n=1 Tax=Labeo rohita TaxID=84645 RepID=A0A498LEG2_LABRO|nr:putative protein K02A2.6-like protein [Labeo rohita]